MATINGNSIGEMYLQIDYSYTQNTTANTSTVTATLKLVNHYALYATALSGSYISVGGSKTEYSKSISYDNTSATTTTTLATKTVTVSHNNDGTATCALAGTFVMNGTYRGYSVGTMSVSSTITLPTIPRSSGLTVATSVNTGSSLSGSVTPSNSAFNHKVEFKVGSTLKNTITLAANQTAPTFTQAISHDWFPNSTSGTVTVVLSTYSGTTLIATTTKNVTANVPSTVVPSISAFTSASSVTSGTFSGLYVQGKTTAKLTATATAGSGSSIVSYTYSGLGINSTATTNTATTATLASSGSQTYTVTVKDARGRTASKTVTITVYPYAVPTIGPVSVQRCDSSGNLSDSGTYAKYTVNSTYSTVNGKNTRTVTAAYSSDNGSTYSSETTLQATSDTAGAKTGTYGGGSLSTATSYIVRFTIKDTYGATATITAPLQSAARPMNIKANGKGVAFGKMAETDNLLDVSWGARVRGNLTVDGTQTVTGNSTLKGTLGVTGNTTLSGTLGVTGATTLNKAASITDDAIGLLTVKRNHASNAAAIKFQNNTTVLGYIGMTGSAANAEAKRWDTNTSVAYTLLDTGNLTNTIKDYVVETGTSGIWTYRKWNSGIAECWGIHTMTSACTATWGSLYYSNTPCPRIDYPFTFTSRPQETVSLRLDTYAAWPYADSEGKGLNTTTQTAIYGFLRPSTMDSRTVRYEFTVIGRWK